MWVDVAYSNNSSLIFMFFRDSFWFRQEKKQTFAKYFAFIPHFHSVEGRENVEQAFQTDAQSDVSWCEAKLCSEEKRKNINC